MTQPALFATGDPRSPAHTQPLDPGQEPMPAWLVAQLIRDGHIDAETRATRRARMSFCPRCRRPVIIGMDADTSRPHAMAMAVTVDPRPLTALGEIQAKIGGRLTWSYRWIGDRYQLDPRGRAEFQRAPAGSHRGMDVMVQHDCVLSELPLPYGPSQAHQERLKYDPADPDQPPPF